MRRIDVHELRPAEAAPFRDGAFDAVWASQVVHHVADPTAFATTIRRVLRPGGHLLIRGGFGPVQHLPLHRWFLSAWAANWAVRLSLNRIAAALAAAGVIPVTQIRISQIFAATTGELEGRVATRALSNLAALPDEEFRAGLAALRRDVVAGLVEQPIGTPHPPAQDGHRSVSRRHAGAPSISLTNQDLQLFSRGRTRCLPGLASQCRPR